MRSKGERDRRGIQHWLRSRKAQDVEKIATLCRGIQAGRKLLREEDTLGNSVSWGSYSQKEDREGLQSARQSHPITTEKYLFFGIADIEDRCIDSTAKSLTEDGLNNSAAWVVPAWGNLSSHVCKRWKSGDLRRLDLATSQAFYNMVFDSQALRDYVYARLDKADANPEWEPLISTGTQANLNAEKVKGFQMAVPCCEEADLVGSFFRGLDSLIALHQRERVESRLQVKTTFQDKSSQQIIGSHAHFECGDRRTLDGREVFARSRRIHAVNQLVEAAELVKALFFHSGGQQLRQQRRIYTKQAGRLPNLRNSLAWRRELRHIMSRNVLPGATKTSPL